MLRLRRHRIMLVVGEIARLNLNLLWRYPGVCDGPEISRQRFFLLELRCHWIILVVYVSIAEIYRCHWVVSIFSI
jgi:hypothetical protein